MAEVVFPNGPPSLDAMQRLLFDMSVQSAENYRDRNLVVSTLNKMGGRGRVHETSPDYAAVHMAYLASDRLSHKYEEYAFALGLAHQSSDTPTVMTESGQVWSTADMIDEAAQLCVNERAHTRLLCYLVMSSDMYGMHPAIAIPPVKSGRENHNRFFDIGQNRSATSLDNAQLLTKLLASPIPDLGKNNWRGNEFRHGCAAFFSHVLRFGPGRVRLHRDWAGLFYSSEMFEDLEERINGDFITRDASEIIDSLLLSASSWHIFEPGKLDYEEEPSSEDRVASEDRWTRWVIDPVNRCIEEFIRDNDADDIRAFIPDNSWKPAFFDQIRAEMTGKLTKRDYDGNVIRTDRDGQPPVGFPAAWHRQPFARMCAVFGAYNAIEEFALMLRKASSAEGGTPRAQFSASVKTVLRRLGVAHATSHVTAIEIVVFCVVQWVVLHIDLSIGVMVFSDEARSPEDVQSIKRAVIRCLRFLLSARASDPFPLLDSQACWRTSDIEYASPRWHGAHSCLELCETLRAAFRTNKVAQFCEDFITQLGM